MNKYLKFSPLLIGWTEPIDPKYMLLSHYVDDCKYGVDEEIEFLEKVKRGDEGYDYKTLQLEPTDYGNGTGGLDFSETLSKGLVYFESYDKKNPSFDLPIDEVIEILKEFKEHIKKHNNQ